MAAPQLLPNASSIRLDVTVYEQLASA